MDTMENVSEATECNMHPGLDRSDVHGLGDEVVSPLHAALNELSLVDGAQGIDSEVTFPCVSSIAYDSCMATDLDDNGNDMEQTCPFLKYKPEDVPPSKGKLKHSQSPTSVSHDLAQVNMSVPQVAQSSLLPSPCKWDIRLNKARLEEEGPCPDPFKPRNVVRFCWIGEYERSSDRSLIICKFLLESTVFQPKDIFAVINLPGQEYEVYFHETEYYQKFWSLYQEPRTMDVLKSFSVVPIARPGVKGMMIYFTDVNIHPEDILLWLKQHCIVLTPLIRRRDRFGDWTGAWRVHVKLKLKGQVYQHLPATFFIGSERGDVVYQGQPRYCYKCDSRTHFSRQCSNQKSNPYNKVGLPPTTSGSLGKTQPEFWKGVVTQPAGSSKLFSAEDFPELGAVVQHTKARPRMV
ncbi:uncharacterized protein LOC108710055 [Xenopus laevis]|uniref:Uncharacterized protein LOC108710055 n=1 Tax=Xenopus laevis TaxID=8355 RepID=A0A8J0UEI4_XENLA|nr:uncharacterized protein LOC108710055 [Xenopus laevis]